MYNRIILIGRLTRDPEGKYTPSGVPVTTFSIAVDRPQSSEARQQGRDKETDFIDIVTWRQNAEFAASYLQKGRMVVVEGKLQIRSYVTQDGQQRKAAEVVADNVRPLDRPRSADDGEDDGGPSAGYTAPAARSAQTGRPGTAPRPAGSAAAAGAAGSAAAGSARPFQSGRAPAPAAPAYDAMDDLADPFAE